MRQLPDCQLKIDACKKLISGLILIEALYEGFPSESMQKALSETRKLLEYQRTILRNLQREQELKRLSHSRD